MGEIARRARGGGEKALKKLALIFINYNTREDLRRALASLRELGREEECEVLVVDNGSRDGSQRMVEEEFPEVRLLDNPVNGGYAQACNLGAAACEAPFLMVLNSDVEFHRGHPLEMVRWMEENPGAGAAGPRLLNSDGSIQFSCRNFPSLPVSIGHAFLGDLFPNNPFTRSYQMKGCRHDRPMRVEWVSGAAMLLRRSAFEEAGGFDEGYFMYVEDVDLCWRLRLLGWGVHYLPEVELVHHVGRSSSQNSVRMLYEHHRSMLRFFRRRHPGPAGRALVIPVLGGLAARFLLVLALRRLRGGGS